MTIIDFSIDESAIEEDVANSFETVSPGALEETFFVMPVRFCVGGVEMLQLPGTESVWLPLPIFGFAADMLEALESAEGNQEKRVYLAGGGHLIFKKEGEFLSLVSSLNSKTTKVETKEIQGAFKTFSAQVKQLLENRAPALQQHPSWKRWFS